MSFPAFFQGRFRRPRVFAAVAALLLLAFAFGLWRLLGTRRETSLLAWGTPGERVSIEKLLGEFARRHWRVKTTLETVSDPTLAAEALLERAREGKAPDAAFVRAGDLDALLAAKALQPIVSAAGKESSGQITALRSAFERDGKTFALPIGWSALMLYYDRALFESRGIPLPQEFWDWGDLLAAAQTLTQNDGGGAGTIRDGLALEGSAEEIAAFIWQNRGQLTDEKGAWTLTDPRFAQSNEEALRFYASLVNEHRVASLPGSGDAFARFASKRAAMAIGSRAWAAKLAEIQALDWDLAPLPKGRESATCLEAFGVGTPRGAGSLGAGAQLAIFLARETAQAVLAAHGGMAPARVPLLSSKIFTDFPPRRPARNAALVRSLPFARTLGFGPRAREASARLAAEARALMADPKASARAALERLQADLEKLRESPAPGR
ncbi:MAG: extracellular solute-binding protein [Verrucomicrobiae bacterium]|nr:extracellular solute-binding protein [Verrucomicrobiae bacterium]